MTGKRSYRRAVTDGMSRYTTASDGKRTNGALTIGARYTTNDEHKRVGRRRPARPRSSVLTAKRPPASPVGARRRHRPTQRAAPRRRRCRRSRSRHRRSDRESGRDRPRTPRGRLTTDSSDSSGGRTGERSRHSTSSSVSNRPRVHAGCRRGIIDQRDDIKPQYERAKFRRDPACGYISPVLTVSSVRRFILSYSTLSTIWNPRTHLEIVTTAVLPWN